MRVRIALITLAVINVVLLIFFWMGQVEKEKFEFNPAKVYKPANSTGHRAYFETILFRVGSEYMFIDGFRLPSGLVRIDDTLYIDIPGSGVFWGSGLNDYQHDGFKVNENKYTYYTSSGILAFEQNAMTYEIGDREFDFSTQPIVHDNKDSLSYVSVSLPIETISSILNMKMTYHKESGLIVFSKDSINNITAFEKYFDMPSILGPLRYQEDYTDFEYQLTTQIVKGLLDTNDRIAKRFISSMGWAGPYDLAITIKPTYAENENYSSDGRMPPNYLSAPLLYDGIIFLVDKDNPVESLTIEDLRSIYTGRITNWNKLGGSNQEITTSYFPYRDEILMYALDISEVEDNQTYSFPTAPNYESDYYYSGIVGEYSIEQSLRYGYPRDLPPTDIYSKAKGALNMSLYFYNINNDMGYKMLKIDNVEATNETIMGKTYPLLIDYYLHVNKNTCNNPNVKMVTSSLQSDKGKELLARSGYIKH